MRILLILFLSYLSIAGIKAQIPARDTLVIPTDSIEREVQADTIVPSKIPLEPAIKIPEPRKATIYSLILPGAGQVYNGQWWKVPIIYGGGYLFYDAITTNNKNYKTFRDAYILRVDDDPETVDQYEGILSENGLKSRRDFYNKNRQLSIIGATVLYFLNGLDAFISAHLKSFDISDDLSFEYRSVPSFSNNNQIPGISLTYIVDQRNAKSKPAIIP